jgi:hypothetical protein
MNWEKDLEEGLLKVGKKKNGNYLPEIIKNKFKIKMHSFLA